MYNHRVQKSGEKAVEDPKDSGFMGWPRGQVEAEVGRSCSLQVERTLHSSLEVAQLFQVLTPGPSLAMFFHVEL
jgi:hypothetical protein